MVYISLNYYVFIILALVMYYTVPVSKRWTILLVANAAFYIFFYKTGWWIFLVTIVTSYLLAVGIEKVQGTCRKLLLIIGIIGLVLPWLLTKNVNFFGSLLGQDTLSWIAPIGISFYTLQIIAYEVDVYTGKIESQKNIFKYALFISFFPQILQGPIPRYEQLNEQLIEGHKFDERKVVQGFCYILWGFFLKLVIADKAAVFVNTVFNNYPAYTGVYIWVASFLFSIQLYADFLACTSLAQGVAKLFGIELSDNFRQPYFATSIKEFWRRWHISLSTWLRDYVYIPLGGNRKGKFRKYVNLVITFLLSGIWHGSGFQFIFWGLLHAGYQIVGEFTSKARENIYLFFKIDSESKVKKQFRQIVTFLFVNWAWIIFRADNLSRGLSLIKHMFWEVNPWVLLNDRIFTLGLDGKEFLVLMVGITLLFVVGRLHENGISVSNRILNQRLPIRWGIYILTIIGIMIFGTYGFGFDTQDFIYGGF